MTLVKSMDMDAMSCRTFDIYFRHPGGGLMRQVFNVNLPKCKHVRSLRERQFYLLVLSSSLEVTDDLGGEVTQPTLGYTQVLAFPTTKTTGRGNNQPSGILRYSPFLQQKPQAGVTTNPQVYSGTRPSYNKNHRQG